MANYYFFYRFVKNSVLFFILVVHINNTSYITSFRAKGSARTLVRLRNQRLRNHVRHEKKPMLVRIVFESSEGND